MWFSHTYTVPFTLVTRKKQALSSTYVRAVAVSNNSYVIKFCGFIFHSITAVFTALVEQYLALAGKNSRRQHCLSTKLLTTNRTWNSLHRFRPTSWIPC